MNGDCSRSLTRRYPPSLRHIVLPVTVYLPQGLLVQWVGLPELNIRKSPDLTRHAVEFPLENELSHLQARTRACRTRQIPQIRRRSHTFPTSSIFRNQQLTKLAR